MRISKGVKADIDGIVKVHIQSWQAYFAQEEYNILIAEEKHEIIGFISWGGS